MQGREPGKRTTFLHAGFRRQAMRGKTMRLGIVCVGGSMGFSLFGWFYFHLFWILLFFFFFGSAIPDHLFEVQGGNSS